MPQVTYLTGGRCYVEPDRFEGGWLALLTRSAGGWTRAHWYVCDGDAYRAICGKHIVAVTDALPFYPGNWRRCGHCQKIFDRQWH